MAEASCSGTTPFKRLIDQQGRDSSHHQDRLRDQFSLHSQSAFKSSPQQSNQAQQGFANFLDGQGPRFQDPAARLAAHAATLDPSQAPRFHHQPFSPSPLEQSRASPAPDVSNWAADFQRFSAQSQLPIAAPGMVSQAPMAAQYQPFQPQQQPFHAAFAQPAFSLPQSQQQQTDFDQEMSRWMANYSNAGTAAATTAAAAPVAMPEVDAMMDQVARELELNQSTFDSSAQKDSTTETTSANVEATRLTDLETPEIGNLSLEPQHQAVDPVAAEDTPATKGKSAVSEAAERLLESVQHEDGDKWKNSVFLSLMRDFRDGRKDIIDNEICQTDAAPAAVPPAGADALPTRSSG